MNSCQQASKGVLDPSFFNAGKLGNAADGLKITVCKKMTGFPKGYSLPWNMKRFRKQMGQRETKIKGSIAEMNHFMIDQMQLFLMCQNILWTEISVNQKLIFMPGRFHQFLKKGLSFWNL